MVCKDLFKIDIVPNGKARSRCQHLPLGKVPGMFDFMITIVLHNTYPTFEKKYEKANTLSISGR